MEVSVWKKENESSKKYLLDLYNALHDSSYTDPEALEVVTMKDVIFMKMKNDLSFMIDSRLWQNAGKTAHTGIYCVL